MAIILLPLLPAFFLSCSKKSGGSPEPRASVMAVPVPSPFVAVAPSPRASPRKAASVPSPLSRDGGGAPPKPAIYGAPSGYQNLVLSPYEVITPEDFDLGPLQYRHPPAESADALRSSLIYAFLDSLLAKKPDPALMVAVKAEAIKRSMAPLLLPETRLSSYRVGSILPSGDTAHATFFLYSGNARAHGAVYLWKSSGTWLVDGVDFDLASLSAPRSDLPRRYEATEYRSFYY